MYYIINKSGKRLSQFRGYDSKPKLLFGNRDCYIYTTYNEAIHHLEYIQTHGIGKNLSIVKGADYVLL